MLSIIKFACGIVCGCALSQFPEYSQQYVQRMGGALDELNLVVSDFDTSAKSAGYTRDQALEAMTGSTFLDARQTDMKTTFTRFDMLTQDYTRLQNAGAFGRLSYVARMRDSDISKGTLADFKPALPLSVEGAGFVGIGFLLGYMTLAGLMRLLFRPRKQVQA